jgi:hypothetical protein
MRGVFELPLKFRRAAIKLGDNFAHCISRKGAKARRRAGNRPQLTQMFADKFK